MIVFRNNLHVPRPPKTLFEMLPSELLGMVRLSIETGTGPIYSQLIKSLIVISISHRFASIYTVISLGQAFIQEKTIYFLRTE